MRPRAGCRVRATATTTAASGRNRNRAPQKPPPPLLTRTPLPRRATAAVKDAKAGTGKACQVGDRAVYEWEGYTIGYFGRPFEAKGGVKGGAFQGDQDFDRFVVGRGQVVPALEEAIVGMKEGGVRQLVFGTDLGYPFIGDEQEGKLVDPGHDKVGPKPHTFSGMRALNFVLENKGDNVDKTLLLNVKLVRVDQKGAKSF